MTCKSGHRMFKVNPKGVKASYSVVSRPCQLAQYEAMWNCISQMLLANRLNRNMCVPIPLPPPPYCSSVLSSFPCCCTAHASAGIVIMHTITALYPLSPSHLTDCSRHHMQCSHQLRQSSLLLHRLRNCWQCCHAHQTAHSKEQQWHLAGIWCCIGANNGQQHRDCGQQDLCPWL